MAKGPKFECNLKFWIFYQKWFCMVYIHVKLSLLLDGLSKRILHDENGTLRIEKVSSKHKLHSSSKNLHNINSTKMSDSQNWFYGILFYPWSVTLVPCATQLSCDTLISSTAYSENSEKHISPEYTFPQMIQHKIRGEREYLKGKYVKQCLKLC